MYSSSAQHWANKRSSGQHLAHDLLEKPAMEKLLPDLKNKKILSIGCGSGEELELLISAGASEIVGIDSSAELLEQARFNFPDQKFVTMKAEELDFGDQTFDFVYSSLTLHYLANWPDFFEKLKKICKPGTEFVFSTHHPIKWGGQATRSKEFNEFKMGYKKDKNDSTKSQIYGDYLNYREVQDTLFGRIPITYYHRSISQMLNEIKVGGWELVKLVEPQPLESSQRTHPDFYETYTKIPLFLILVVRINL